MNSECVCVCVCNEHAGCNSYCCSQDEVWIYTCFISRVNYHKPGSRFFCQVENFSNSPCSRILHALQCLWPSKLNPLCTLLRPSKVSRSRYRMWSQVGVSHRDPWIGAFVDSVNCTFTHVNIWCNVHVLNARINVLAQTLLLYRFCSICKADNLSTSASLIPFISERCCSISTARGSVLWSISSRFCNNFGPSPVGSSITAWERRFFSSTDRRSKSVQFC